VLDVRQSYGRTDYLVTPIGVDGQAQPEVLGSVWASVDKVVLVPAASPESDDEEARRRA
jgi:hypothetical protein